MSEDKKTLATPEEIKLLNERVATFVKKHLTERVVSGNVTTSTIDMTALHLNKQHQLEVRTPTSDGLQITEVISADGHVLSGPVVTVPTLEGLSPAAKKRWRRRSTLKANRCASISTRGISSNWKK